MPRDRPGPSSRRVVEEEMDFSASQGLSQMTQQTQSLTQAQRAADTLPREVIDRKVSELVQYMLITNTKKNPVKRADISKNVLKEHRAILPEALRRANIVLQDIFGFELVEVEHSTGKTKTKFYFLLNMLKPELTQGLVGVSDETKHGLLWIILSLIFMNEGSVNDGQLWHLLQKLGINQDEKEHPVYGDIKKLVTQDFTKQLYLDCTKIANTQDPIEYEFKWGPRAEKEMDKERVLNLVAEIHGEDPRKWKTQYRQVLISKGIDPDAVANGHRDGDEDEVMEED